MSKLEELVKIRRVMKFNSLSDRSVECSSYPFSRAEVALLQKIPKGTVLVGYRTLVQSSLPLRKKRGKERNVTSGEWDM